MKLCDICGTLREIEDLEECTQCGQVNCETCLPTCEHAIENYIQSLEEIENWT
jgi:hypothetical protein